MNRKNMMLIGLFLLGAFVEKKFGILSRIGL